MTKITTMTILFATLLLSTAMTTQSVFAEQIAADIPDFTTANHEDVEIIQFRDGANQCSKITFEGATDFGILDKVGEATFSGAVAIIDSDAGGSASIANEPSPETVMFQQSGNGVIDVTFDNEVTSVEFWHVSSNSATGKSATIFDASNNALGTEATPPTNIGSTGGDPTGIFDTWELVTFDTGENIIKKLSINTQPNQQAYDDLVFCTAPDPLGEILKEIKDIWMAIERQVIPLLEGIDAKIDAQTDKVSVTVNLDEIKLKTGEVMVLLDTTGTGKLSTVHVAANLPCNLLGDGKPTDGGANDDPSIWIVAGVAGGGLSGVINDATDDTGFVGPEKTCVFHDTIDAADVDGGMITDVIIIHPDNHPPMDDKKDEPKKHEKLKGVVVTITGTYE